MGKTEDKQSSHKNITYAIGLYRLIAQYLGIWCLTCQNFIPKCLISVMCILMVNGAVSLFNELNPNCRPLSEALIPFSIGLSSSLAFIKILSIRLNRKKMQEIVTSIIKNWSDVSTLHECKAIANMTLLSRLFCGYQLISAFIASLPMLLSKLGNSVTFNAETNITEVVRLLPLPNACFYKSISSSFYVELYIFECIQLISIIIGNVGNDCYFFGITMHLVDQVQCLAHHIRNYETGRDELQCEQMLRSLIQRHSRVIALAKYLEDIFSVVIAFQVMANIFQVLLAGLEVLNAIRKNDVSTSVNFLSFSLVFMLQTFIYCYAGEKLSCGINNLNTAFYYSQWYDRTPRTRKDLIFVMIQCRKPFNLTAGKIMPMNLDSFKSIIKTLGSYFSVIQAMFAA